MANGCDPYIGFAVRSKNVVFGAEGLLSCRRRVYAVVYDAALGKDGRKKLARFGEKFPSCAQEELPEGHLAELLKRDGVKVVGVTDEHLAQAIVNTFMDARSSDGGR